MGDLGIEEFRDLGMRKAEGGRRNLNEGIGKAELGMRNLTKPGYLERTSVFFSYLSLPDKRIKKRRLMN